MALSYSRKARSLLSRLKPSLAVYHFRRSKYTFVEDGSCTHLSSYMGSYSAQPNISEWRKLDSRHVGLARSMISLASWTVLRVLREKGFQAYLVGGCVRDLLLNKVPKDFDVITTARLQQVKRNFQRAMIVGKRFPICMVTIKGFVVEVSSFDTVANESGGGKAKTSPMPKGCDPSDFLRWQNSLHRDFTVNSLFFDPFENKIYDYSKAMMDLKSLKLRTVKPAHLSFKEDQARILRGLRLAARLNLSFAEETEDALHSLSSSVAGLNTSRILMEMNYMLSYGAAESSILLLKKFQLLDLLLPFHAAYLSEQVRNGLDERSLMLMKLFFNLDQLISCSQPGTESLWVAILAFHLAIFRNPQHPIVALTFASLLHNRTVEESIKFARQNVLATTIYTPEIVGISEDLLDDEIVERVTLFVGQIKNSVDVLIKKKCLLESMTRFPDFPCSGLIVIPQRMRIIMKNIFHIQTNDVSSVKANERSQEIRYRLLKGESVKEIKFVLGKIITTTLVDSIKLGQRAVAEDGKNDSIVMSQPPKSGVSKQTRKTSRHLSKKPGQRAVAEDGNNDSIVMHQPPKSGVSEQTRKTSGHLTEKLGQRAVSEDGKNDSIITHQPPKSGVSEQTRKTSGHLSKKLGQRAVAEDGNNDSIVMHQPPTSGVSERTRKTTGHLSNLFAMEKRNSRAAQSNSGNFSDSSTKKTSLSDIFTTDKRKRRATQSNHGKFSEGATKRTRLSKDNTTASSYSHRSPPGKILKDEHVKTETLSDDYVLSGGSK